MRAGTVNLADPVTVDTDLPAPGTGYFYLVDGINDCGEGPAGINTDLQVIVAKQINGGLVALFVVPGIGTSYTR